MSGSCGIAVIFFTSTPDGDEWSASRPCLITSGVGVPRYLFTRKLGGPKVSNNAVERGKIFSPSGNRIPAVQPVDLSSYRCSYTGSRINLLILYNARQIGVSMCKQKQSYPCNRPWRPMRFWNVEDPTLSRRSAHRWRLGCQPYDPAALSTQKFLLVLVLLRHAVR
jgi:hypothetical protein